MSFCSQFVGCCFLCFSEDLLVFNLDFLADCCDDLVQMYLLCLLYTFLRSFHSFFILLLPFPLILIQFIPGLSFHLHPENLQLTSINFVPLMFFRTLMRISPHRFFLTLLVNDIQSLAPLVLADLLLDEPWTSGDFFDGIFLEDWHSFLVF